MVGLYGRESRSRQTEMKDKRLFLMLTRHWQGVVNDLVKNLTEAYSGSSGLTRQSIGSLNKKPVEVTTRGFKISISMPDHYQFLDEGVSGAKYNKNISRFKYTDKLPPIKDIRRFMLNRGITEPLKANTRSGRKRDTESQLNSIAFAIARSIYEKGTKASHFYSDVINDKEILAFGQKVAAQYKDYILSVVEE